MCNYSHFYYVFAGRRDVVGLLPPRTIGCEIGVQKGAFSRIILEKAAPSCLHLIDPWMHFETREYSSDGANVPQREQDKIYDGVVSEFRKPIAEGQIVIHRKTSESAVSDFETASLDFVYVDGMHNFEAVLADLVSYAPKLKRGGLLMGHDYSENLHSHRMGFGVVGAVNSFTNRSDFRLIAVTHETWSTFILASDPAEGPAKYFLDKLLNSKIEIVGLPSLMAPNLKHESVRRDDGTIRWVPHF